MYFIVFNYPKLTISVEPLNQFWWNLHLNKALKMQDAYNWKTEIFNNFTNDSFWFVPQVCYFSNILGLEFQVPLHCWYNLLKEMFALYQFSITSFIFSGCRISTMSNYLRVRPESRAESGCRALVGESRIYLPFGNFWTLPFWKRKTKQRTGR